ncbi:hypothetical protein F2B00_34325 [Streptomyces parvus]|uniref:hypothetical protein n=1 Tax=Streptomyces parvus TaxID=66428 RepID=UPI0012389B8B|nr:hypothetical protein [Streptomyces parvus]KAA6197845.1 hypothetical protein F2B00_34325 [Streptomyces parvus]GGS60699.1 hypothetical protein GCM10010221_69480 [Streptomyces parvus]
MSCRPRRPPRDAARAALAAVRASRSRAPAGAVSAVLTKKDADIDALLKDAQSKIDGILARG